MSKRTRRDRLASALAGLYGDAPDIAEAVARESSHGGSWRPVRAGALLAMADEATPGDHVWMTTAEFAAWLAQHFPLRSSRARLLNAEVGITLTRRKSILDGAPISKVEALACAHYALGLGLPVTPGDVDGFVAWVEPRFGQVRAVTLSLRLSQSYIADRMRGYDITNAGRRARAPEPELIRALDWTWRIGSHSPYGRRPPVELFPNQRKETP